MANHVYKAISPTRVFPARVCYGIRKAEKKADDAGRKCTALAVAASGLKATEIVFEDVRASAAASVKLAANRYEEAKIQAVRLQDDELLAKVRLLDIHMEAWKSARQVTEEAKKCHHIAIAQYSRTKRRKKAVQEELFTLRKAISTAAKKETDAAAALLEAAWTSTPSSSSSPPSSTSDPQLPSTTSSTEALKGAALLVEMASAMTEEVTLTTKLFERTSSVAKAKIDASRSALKVKHATKQVEKLSAMAVPKWHPPPAPQPAVRPAAHPPILTPAVTTAAPIPTAEPAPTPTPTASTPQKPKKKTSPLNQKH